MIRVLTFGRYADDNFGGLERYVFELARGLKGQVEFTNIVAERGIDPDTPTGSETVYARPLAHLGGTPICPSMPFHALRMHRARHFDIAHLQFPADPMAHLSTVLLPQTVARVVTWHSDIVRQRGLLRLYQPFLERLIRSAAAIVVPTPTHVTSSQHLQRSAAADKIHVVPFGLDYGRFLQRPAAAEALRARHGDRFLIFALGRHVYYKGFEYLVRAMRELPDSAAIIGGRGPLTDSLAAMAAELKLADRVHFVGRISEAELPAYYHACDVFCMPSVERSEAFGIAQLEAMAAAKPVVCCELGNGVNYVNRDGETGLAVRPKDPAALASALRRLQSDPALRVRLGEEGRRRALREFSLEKMREGTLAVYRQALAQPRL